jgi:hypothetical protein
MTTKTWTIRQVVEEEMRVRGPSSFKEGAKARILEHIDPDAIISPGMVEIINDRIQKEMT